MRLFLDRANNKLCQSDGQRKRGDPMRGIEVPTARSCGGAIDLILVINELGYATS